MNTSLQKHTSAEIKNESNEESLIDDSPNIFLTNLEFEMKNKNKKLRHPQVDKVRKQLIREAPKRFKTSNLN